MNYEEDFLLQIIKEKPQKGDVVRITYYFGSVPSYYNDILITDSENELLAVWLYGEYKGKSYKILDYQIITKILCRNIDVDQYFKNLHNSTIIKEFNDESKYIIFNKNGNVELISESTTEGIFTIERSFDKPITKLNNELITQGHIIYQEEIYYVKNYKVKEFDNNE